MKPTLSSTFKIPHALAALDAGVVSGPGEMMKYDARRRRWTPGGTTTRCRRRCATRSSSGSTTFWLGGSLQITPEEQLRFMRRLYRDELPVSPAAMRTVRQLIVQPEGVVVNAVGQHPFAAPWPQGTTISAKTGSGTDRGGQSVRWLVGQVARAGRSWIFVSCVAGGDDIPALAAVDQAAAALREDGVLR